MILHDATHWRIRAEETRTLASKLDPELKRTTLGIADGYEKLALYAEARTAYFESRQG
jgi:hypothetical protein